MERYTGLTPKTPNNRWSAVQLDGGGEFESGLLQPCHLEVQLSEAEVAGGLESAFSELVGQSEGLPVVVLG